MSNSFKNLLITGRPGSGKTTLIKKVADELLEYKPVGFYTGEIRSNGIRTGFAITSIDRKRTGTLAHVDIKSQYRVGKYGVDLPGFEQFLESLPLFDPPPRLVIIDEIGKMECLSAKFRDLVVSLLNGPVPVIATIAMKAAGFIDEVKRRPDVRIYEITERPGLCRFADCEICPGITRYTDLRMFVPQIVFPEMRDDGMRSRLKRKPLQPRVGSLQAICGSSDCIDASLDHFDKI